MSAYYDFVDKAMGTVHGICYGACTAGTVGLAIFVLSDAILAACDHAHKWYNSHPKDKSTVVLNGRIDINTIEPLIKQISRMKGELNLVIHTIGGEVNYAVALVKVLYEYKDPIHIWIPKKALSGGTLIVLALLGKKDVTVTMSRYAFLSPFDPINGADGISKPVLEEFEKRDSKNDVFKSAPAIKQWQKDIAQLVQPLFTRLNNAEVTDRVTKDLMSGMEHDHFFPLIRSEIVKMGIPISESDVIPANFARFVE
jgi:ATP-dependent protease ClpP protease subunit